MQKKQPIKSVFAAACAELECCGDSAPQSTMLAPLHPWMWYLQIWPDPTASFTDRRSLAEEMHGPIMLFKITLNSPLCFGTRSSNSCVGETNLQQGAKY